MMINVIEKLIIQTIQIYLTKSSIENICLFIEFILNEFRIQNSATPLWNLSYEEQLTKKSTIVQEFLKGLEEKIKEIR